MTSENTTLDTLASDVFLFNEIAGNFKEVSKEKLVAQAKVVLEESQELLQALVNNEGEEQLLKETIDVLVTVLGMFGMLKQQGYNVEAAWNVVNKNNLTKFCHSYSDALNGVLDYSAQGIKVVYERSPPHIDRFYYILRDENGKVRKPLGYKKCSVKQFTPSN